MATNFQFISPEQSAVKAIGYVRVSTHEQASEGVSIDAQRSRIDAYCTAHGLDLVEIIEDSGVSGTVPLEKRPNGKRLLLRNADHVVAVRLDRIFRDAAEALTVTKAWDRASVGLHLIDMGGQSINTASATGRMMLTMMAGFAELERSLIAERTKDALREKKSQREVYGPIAYGYRDNDGKLVAAPEEQLIVAEVKQMRKAGMAYKPIADDLNGRGIVGKKGGRFYACTVRDICRNDLHA